MKIAFINPSLRPESKRRQLPVGLASILTAVKKAGFEFDLIDMDIDRLSMDDLRKILESKMYDIYAFGCIVTGFKFAREIAAIIKDVNPSSVIVAGNSVASSIPEILLNHTRVDIAVMGEGDITIVELLRTLDVRGNISDVKGIAFKRGGNIVYTPKRPIIKDINKLGFPDWSIFDLEKYNEYGTINVNRFTSDKIISFPLNTARGCPFNCTFCYHVFKGERYRRYTEESVTSEMRRLYNRYNCDMVSFWDELSFINIESVETMAKKIGSLEFTMDWDMTARGNLFKKEHINLIRDLKDLRCKSVSFSLENADPEILRAMNKRMDISQFVEQAKVLWKGDVVPLTSVVFGYPQETPDTIRQTLKICEECDIYPSVGFLLPLPGTPIYEWAKKEGYIKNEVVYLGRIGDRQDFHINLTRMSDEGFISTVESGLRDLAKKQGIKVESVLKTTTYQKPQKLHSD